MTDTPNIGSTRTLTGTVTDTRTAAHLAETGEHLPEVFATPFMIADMERACAALLADVLAQGEVAVGAKIDVTHLAPTPVGTDVRASARFTGQEGPLYWFDVWAEDAGGKIGEGRIARAIVPSAKLMARAETRR